MVKAFVGEEGEDHSVESKPRQLKQKANNNTHNNSNSNNPKAVAEGSKEVVEVKCDDIEEAALGWATTAALEYI